MIEVIRRNLPLFTFAAAIGLAMAPVMAADTDEEEKPATADATSAKWLDPIRNELKSENYEGAIKRLKAANKPDSANWNNLMGYSLRKKSPPDLKSAESHYRAALKIDPAHKGALEYYGELKLMQHDKPGADQLMKTLEKACPSGCEQLDDLREAISNYQPK